MSNTKPFNSFVRAVKSPQVAALLALAMVVGMACIVEPRFMTQGTLRSILMWTPLLLIASMGQMLVILTRGIDVSAGSTMALAGMIVAMVWRDHPGVGVVLGSALGVALGGVLGAFNGLLIVLVRIPPIVTTLGTLGIYRGLTHIASAGVQVEEYELPRSLGRWSIEGPCGQTLVPWIVVVAVAIAALNSVFLGYTRLGRHIYAVGGNPDAAKLRGVPVAPVTCVVYILSGMAAGLAGVFYASRFGTVNPASIGAGFELIVITAVVVGGVSVFGGSGTVIGVLCGTLLLGVVYTTLTVAGVATAWQTVCYGLAILLAVTFDDLLAGRLRSALGARWI